MEISVEEKEDMESNLKDSIDDGVITIDFILKQFSIEEIFESLAEDNFYEMGEYVRANWPHHN